MSLKESKDTIVTINENPEKLKLQNVTISKASG